MVVYIILGHWTYQWTAVCYQHILRSSLIQRHLNDDVDRAQTEENSVELNFFKK